MDLKATVRSIVDWPIKGVVFRDLTTLMAHPEAFRKACDLLFMRYQEKKIDKVVGIDARGFIFGAVVAYKLGVGFVPIRKKGKLPADAFEVSYTLEYGSATMEMHKDGVLSGERVVIVDDLLATGGTIGGAVELVRQCGGEIVECAFLVELPDLAGRDRIADCEIYSIMEFEGE